VSEALATVEPDISKITDYLYISAFPEAEHAATIRALDVRLILSMPIQKPHHEVRMPPVRWLHLRTVDSPLVPMPVSILRRGVEAALPVIDDGQPCWSTGPQVHRALWPVASSRHGHERGGGDGPCGVQARGRGPARLVHPRPHREVRAIVAEAPPAGGLSTAGADGQHVGA
jgi:hypothetical protein